MLAAQINGLLPTADPTVTIGGMVSATIGLLTVIAGVYFIITIITGAIGIIGGAGDKAALETGRQKITTGFIGLAVAIAAIFILGIVAQLLNVPSILDVGSIMQF